MNNNNLHCFTEVVSGYKNFEVKIGVKMCLEFIADLLIVLFLRIHDHDVWHQEQRAALERYLFWLRFHPSRRRHQTQ